jgi:cytidylate kinase
MSDEETAAGARERPVIAIDGPVGAGKSTVARELARTLGFAYLNTGAMYRAVACAARNIGYNDIEAGDPEFERRLGELLENISITFSGDRVMLNGRDVSAEISAPEIGELASRLSTLAMVRAKMREAQRAAGAGGGVVMEGRDIGTAVFPDAEFKFFLTADINVRAQRRHAELAAKGIAVSRAEVMEQLRRRDQRDRARELAPLRRADDAIEIDSSARGVEQIVDAMKARVESAARAVKGLKRD